MIEKESDKYETGSLCLVLEFSLLLLWLRTGRRRDCSLVQLYILEASSASLLVYMFDTFLPRMVGQSGAMISQKLSRSRLR
jgi:hypothetical protein